MTLIFADLGRSQPDPLTGDTAQCPCPRVVTWQAGMSPRKARVSLF